MVLGGRRKTEGGIGGSTVPRPHLLSLFPCTIINTAVREKIYLFRIQEDGQKRKMVI